MNLNKIFVISGIALAIVAVPAANAQRGHRGGNAAGRTGISRPSSVGSSARTFQSRSNRGSRQFTAGRGARFQNGRGRPLERKPRGGITAAVIAVTIPTTRIIPTDTAIRSSEHRFTLAAIIHVTRRTTTADRSWWRCSRSWPAPVIIAARSTESLGVGRVARFDSYERATGLPADGRIDSDLLSAMGIR